MTRSRTRAPRGAHAAIDHPLQRLQAQFGHGHSPSPSTSALANVSRSEALIDQNSLQVTQYASILWADLRKSALFHDKVIRAGVSSREHRYRNALFHLMASQTSCYRYWGQGQWPEYGQEIVRRAEQILLHDF
jgi:hypothetical protein